MRGGSIGRRRKEGNVGCLAGERRIGSTCRRSVQSGDVMGRGRRWWVKFWELREWGKGG